MRGKSLLLPPVVGLSLNVFDDVNVTDALAVQIDNLAIEKSVVDTIATTEFVNVRISLQINVFDTATPTEVVSLAEFIKVNVFDTATPTDSVVIVDLAFIHYWNDIVTFSEPFSHMWDVVSNVTEMFITHQWSIIGTLASITHSWRDLPPQLQTLFDGSIQLIMSVVDWAITKIMVADDILITENVTIRGPSFGVSVSDSISVQEFVSVQLSRRVAVFDIATPIEDVKVVLPLKINVFDNINPTDVITVAPLVIPVSVSDTITVTESVTVVHS